MDAAEYERQIPEGPGDWNGVASSGYRPKKDRASFGLYNPWISAGILPSQEEVVQ